MPKQNLEYKVNYPEFTARNYVLAVNDNPENTPQWDPFNFFIARFLLTKKKDLEKIIGQWITERPKLVKNMRDARKTPVFNLEGEYDLEKTMEKLYEKGRLKRPETEQLELRFDDSPKKTKLTDLTAEQLYWVVREKIREKFGSYKIMDLDYTKFFFENDPKNKDKKAMLKILS